MTVSMAVMSMAMTMPMSFATMVFATAAIAAMFGELKKEKQT